VGKTEGECSTCEAETNDLGGGAQKNRSSSESMVGEGEEREEGGLGKGWNLVERFEVLPADMSVANSRSDSRLCLSQALI